MLREKVRDETDPRSIVPSDINLEKWNIFGTKNSRGLRILKREFQLNGKKQIQMVRVGLEGSTQTLTAEEAKIFYLLLDLWDKNGRSAEGTVYGSFRQIFGRLQGHTALPAGQKKRYGTWQRKWFSEKLNRLMSIPIVFEAAYRNKDGTTRDLESFTLLSKATLFERNKASNTKQLYFDLSHFTIHPVIVKSILEKNMKPILVNVVTGLKKDLSIILYRHLDIIMADKTHFERMVDDLKEEFGLVIARKDNVLRELRECCAELEGVDVTTGRIIYCRVEKAVDGRNWKVVVRKGKQLPQLPAKLSTEGSVVSREEEELMEFYRTLDPEKRVLIDSRRDTIVTSRYHGFDGVVTQEAALLDAIREYQQSDKHPAGSEVRL